MFKEFLNNFFLKKIDQETYTIIIHPTFLLSNTFLLFFVNSYFFNKLNKKNNFRNKK